MIYPVKDLRAFLAGRWRITRRVQDVRQELTGRLNGRANFTTARQGLLYDETGLLCFGRYRGEAERRYLFAFDGPDAASVHHADGRLFHRLSLMFGRADIHHQCCEDHYRGRYRVLDRDAFAVSWDVAGPRKRYRMATFYNRD